MSDGHHLAIDYCADMFDERGCVVGPLGPRVDVASLARTLAVSSQVDRKSAHPVLGHASSEAFVPAGVLTEAVHDRERDRTARDRPRPVRQRRAVGGLERALGVESLLSRQGARTL